MLLVLRIHKTEVFSQTDVVSHIKVEMNNIIKYITIFHLCKDIYFITAQKKKKTGWEGKYWAKKTTFTSKTLGLKCYWLVR